MFDDVIEILVAIVQVANTNIDGLAWGYIFK